MLGEAILIILFSIFFFQFIIIFELYIFCRNLQGPFEEYIGAVIHTTFYGKDVLMYILFHHCLLVEVSHHFYHFIGSIIFHRYLLFCSSIFV